MAPTRREVIASALAIPLIAASAAAVAETDTPESKIEKIIDLPPGDGKVVAMVQFHDDIFIATEYGKIFRLFDLWEPV